MKTFLEILNERAPTPAMRAWIEHRRKEHPDKPAGMWYGLAWKHFKEGKNYRSGRNGKPGSFYKRADKRFRLNKTERTIVVHQILNHLHNGRKPGDIANGYARGMSLGIHTRMTPAYVRGVAHEVAKRQKTRNESLDVEAIFEAVEIFEGKKAKFLGAALGAALAAHAGTADAKGFGGAGRSVGRSVSKSVPKAIPKVSPSKPSVSTPTTTSKRTPGKWRFRDYTCFPYSFKNPTCWLPSGRKKAEEKKKEEDKPKGSGATGAW